MKALLLVSHGSRAPESRDENRALAEKLKEMSGLSVVEYAFLEIDTPDIRQGIETCIKQGAREIIVLPNFLNSGRHVLKDIPEILDQLQSQYPDIHIQRLPHIGAHPRLQELFMELIERAK